MAPNKLGLVLSATTSLPRHRGIIFWRFIA